MAIPRRVRISNGESKYGCFTCRSRRIKCDEQKPFCQRCQKAAIACEGYPRGAYPGHQRLDDTENSSESYSAPDETCPQSRLEDCWRPPSRDRLGRTGPEVYCGMLTAQTFPNYPSPYDMKAEQSDLRQETGQKPKPANVCTGCVICNARHVKCDQTMLACQTCESGGRPRGGFDILKRSPTGPARVQNSSSDTSIVRNNQFDIAHAPQSHAAGVEALMLSYGTSEERRALNFYLTRTGPLVSKFASPHLWTIVVPQASWDHPAVKYGLTAIANLSETLLQSRGKPTDPQHPSMRYYRKQIQCLTRPSMTPPIEIVLLSCLMLYLFENFNRQGKIALIHLQSGLKILKELKAERRTSLDGVLQSIDVTFSEANAYANAWVFDLQDSPVETPYTKAPSTVLPWTFTDLDEAAFFLGQCSRCLTGQKTRLCHGEATNSYLADFISSLRQWADVYERYDGPGRPSDLRYLKVHHLALSIILETWEASSEMIFDNYTKDFRFLTNTCEDLRKGQIQHSRLFKRREFGIIPPLYLVASRCRDRSLRRKAISLLYDLRRIEGAWTSTFAAVVAENIMHVEERLHPGSVVSSLAPISESSRVRESRIESYDAKISLRYIRGLTHDKHISCVEEVQVLGGETQDAPAFLFAGTTAKVAAPDKDSTQLWSRLLRSCGYQDTLRLRPRVVAKSFELDGYHCNLPDMELGGQ